MSGVRIWANSAAAVVVLGSDVPEPERDVFSTHGARWVTTAYQKVLP